RLKNKRKGNKHYYQKDTPLSPPRSRLRLSSRTALPGGRFVTFFKSLIEGAIEYATVRTSHHRDARIGGVN
ncbi:hypothetical protein HN51_017158, partial [Arachis hypogaea]